jgi:hypothetical protein
MVREKGIIFAAEIGDRYGCELKYRPQTFQGGAGKLGYGLTCKVRIHQAR